MLKKRLGALALTVAMVTSTLCVGVSAKTPIKETQTGVTETIINENLHFIH